MATQYSFIGSEQVTVDLAPTLSVEEQQVTAQAIKSGVVFIARFGAAEWRDTALVHDTLNQLAGRFDSWTAVDGVVGIASVENIDTNNMLKLGTQVTVESDSGRSTTVFSYTYPVAEFNTSPDFIKAVNVQRAALNALEG